MANAEERLGLLLNIPAIKAEQTLHRGNYDPTDYRTIRDLYLAAYDDKALAEQAQLEALKRKVDADCNQENETDGSAGHGRL